MFLSDDNMADVAYELSREMETEMSNDDYTTIEDVVIKHMTKKAVLVIIEGKDVWIPMSVIFEDDLAEVEVGLVMELNVATWFYEKEIV